MRISAATAPLGGEGIPQAWPQETSRRLLAMFPANTRAGTLCRAPQKHFEAIVEGAVRTGPPSFVTSFQAENDRACSSSVFSHSVGGCKAPCSTAGSQKIHCFFRQNDTARRMPLSRKARFIALFLLGGTVVLKSVGGPSFLVPTDQRSAAAACLPLSVERDVGL